MPRSLVLALPSRFVFPILGLALCLPAAVLSATPRCDLVGAPQAGSAERACLDLDRLQGDTLIIPSNATRIAEQGLALCKSAVRQGGVADIAYILDQSGSMYARYLWVKPGTQDTTFLENLNGCSAMRASDTVTGSGGRVNLLFEEAGTQSISVLKSSVGIQGCHAFAGDPYGQRGVAFRNAIQYQSELSSSSTAAYLGFNDAVRDAQRPIELSPANVQILKNKIVMRSGGTRYGPPLDSAKRWLNNSALIKTPKQAIVFLSDGKPTDNYAGLLSDGNMPPIYGIYLGNPTADFSKLQQLADSTGGDFYLIPPGDPDSLKTVIRIILNEILKTYTPVSAVLRNESLSPVQVSRSLAADFTPQGESSWLMRLDEIVALSPGTLNAMTLETRFRESVSDSDETRITRFYLRTQGAAASGSAIIADSLFALSCYAPSQLALLGGNGQSLARLTERDSLPLLRLRTSPTLSQTQASLTRGLALNDSLPVNLAKTQSLGDSAVFSGAFSLVAAVNAKARPLSLETRTFDTVTAHWQHPRDGQDTASARLAIVAANRLSTLRFSLTDGGAAAARIPPDRTQAFLVLEDQASASGIRQVTVTSASLGIDAETVTLTETSPGRFQGPFPLNPGVKNPGDGVLQVSPGGDQLRAVFRDPEFGDSAIAQTGFDEAAQEPARLVFLNADGVEIPSGSTLSPLQATGIKMLYQDDFALGALPNKNAALTLSSSWGGQGVMTDQENLAMPTTASGSDNRGHWILALPLFESGSALSGDSRLNFRYRGALVAEVQSHDNTGKTENGLATASLFLAYPDSPAVLTWSQIDTANLGGGAVEGLQLTLRDQDYAPGGMDSTLLHVLCPVAGDSVILTVKEKSPGVYGPASVGRNKNAANPQDGYLSCPDGSDIVVKHVDPVSGSITAWNLPQVATPAVDPLARDFRAVQTVQVSTRTPGARIFYTLNGSLPDTGSSMEITGPLTATATTTLTVMAAKPGFRHSPVVRQTYTKLPNQSRISLLDGNGNPLSDGILSDAATEVTVKVRTTQAGLSEIKPVLYSLRQGDVEEKRLLNLQVESDAFVYTEIMRVGLSAPNAGDDTLSFASTDTLVAVWSNPLDAGDVARDTVIVKPRYLRPLAYFTDSRQGSRTSLYPANQDSAYILIEARPHLIQAAALVLSKQQGNDGETVNLLEIAPGRYAGLLPLAPAAVKTPNDGQLSVALSGDQLTVLFIDPIYGDTALGNAGFAQGVEETGQLFFVDLNGNALGPNASWRPDAGKVILAYQDDWSLSIAGAVTTKTIRLVLNQERDGKIFASDSEQVILQWDTAQGTLGLWRGEIAIAREGLAKPGDGSLQTAYLGKLTAKAETHNNAGNSDQGSVLARLTLVYPDQVPQLEIADEDGRPPKRASEEIHIRLDDGLQLTAGQPLQVKLQCLGTGDTLSIKLHPQDTGSAWVGQVVKGEGKTNLNDTVLTCAVEDQLITTYRDPTHGTIQVLEIRWSDPVETLLYFTRIDDTLPILSLAGTETGKFRVHVIAQSPSRDEVDSLLVTLTGPEGEKETLRLKETGAYTGHFQGDMDYFFSLGPPLASNGKINARVDLSKDYPLALIQAVHAQTTASLSLKTRVIRALKAAVLDRNRDGKADAITVDLATASAELPAEGLEAYWNRIENANLREIKSADMELLPGGLRMEADISANPWSYGATGQGSPSPLARFPSPAPWFGQEVLLSDSLGPIPLKAVKLPSDLKSVAISEFERRFNPDTLILTLSEPLKSLTSLKGLVRFSSGCTGYDQSQPVITFAEPTSNDDRTVWTVLVDNSPQAKLPLTGDCLYLETDGRYSDDKGNRPLDLGVALTGENPRLAIRLVQGYPPVAGISAQEPAFLLANTDNREDRTGRFTRETGGDWDVLWIPPTGFQSNDPMKSYLPSSPSEEPRVSGETTYPTSMPSHIGVVQVATTGRYVAEVAIYDNTGHFVRRFRQAFGYRGELRNPYRSSDKGMLSFLVWDLKDAAGRQVGQGVFIWRIQFAFADGKKEAQVVRTGVLRP